MTTYKVLSSISTTSTLSCGRTLQPHHCPSWKIYREGLCDLHLVMTHQTIINSECICAWYEIALLRYLAVGIYKCEIRINLDYSRQLCIAETNRYDLREASMFSRPKFDHVFCGKRYLARNGTNHCTLPPALSSLSLTWIKTIVNS